MGDSGLIIEFLNREKDVDLNQSLSDADKAVSRAFTKMGEENTYWGGVRNRYMDNFETLLEVMEASWSLRLLMTVTSDVTPTLWAQGMGRHSRDETESIVEKDLKALSTFLGTKPYLMGDEPTEADAAIFGQLSEARCTYPGT
ncbi:failed axon connections homolog [Branchiostoma lanceolatum]|uniref:failed axon connections homolog n=1 Tax=Branchiostoma lanceolatum TaxID=7740 RepID=UPI0034558BCA